MPGILPLPPNTYLGSVITYWCNRYIVSGAHNPRRSVQLAYLLGSIRCRVSTPTKTPYTVSAIIHTYFVKKPVRVHTVLSMKCIVDTIVAQHTWLQ